MVRHPSSKHGCRLRNLSHNTTGIPDASSIWPRRHLKHQVCCRLGTHRQHKQLQINHNNKRENMRRNNHQYKVGDKLIFKRKKNSKHELEFMGPFPITQINYNGTVCSQKGIINDATNIRRIKQFFD